MGKRVRCCNCFIQLPIQTPAPGQGTGSLSGAAPCSMGARGALGWAHSQPSPWPPSLPAERPHRLPTAARSGNRARLYGLQLLARLGQRRDRETVPAPGLPPPQSSPGSRLPARAALALAGKHQPRQRCPALRPEGTRLKPSLNPAAKAVFSAGCAESAMDVPRPGHGTGTWGGRTRLLRQRCPLSRGRGRHRGPAGTASVQSGHCRA